MNGIMIFKFLFYLKFICYSYKRRSFVFSICYSNGHEENQYLFNIISAGFWGARGKMGLNPETPPLNSAPHSFVIIFTLVQNNVFNLNF